MENIGIALSGRSPEKDVSRLENIGIVTAGVGQPRDQVRLENIGIAVALHGRPGTPDSGSIEIAATGH